MARPTTKEGLVQAANVNFAKLWEIVDSMPDEALNTEFDFSNDPKKKEAHWSRDKDLKDIFIHLYEWHQLLLNWVNSNVAGNKSPFIPEPYSWRTYGEMNIEFWEKHRDTPTERAKEMLKSSHELVLSLVKTFSEEELFTKKHFDWTGTTSLGSYCVSAMLSHYVWASKKIRAHTKKFKTG